MSQMNNYFSSNSYLLPQLTPEIFKGIEGSYIDERMNVLKEVLTRIHFAFVTATDAIEELRAYKSMLIKDVKAENEDKLSQLYETAYKSADDQAQLIRMALDLLHEIRKLAKSRQKKLQYGAQNKVLIRRGELMKILNDSAATLPLFIGMFFLRFQFFWFSLLAGKNPNDKAPPLCGSVPAEKNYVAKIGDLVAAYVHSVSTSQAPSQSPDWILAEVVHFNVSTNKYEVDDIDEEQKDRHVVSKRYVIPLPLRRANPETDPQALFPKNTNVLALYPQTTCFYNAMVQEPPMDANDPYKILFEDTSYSEGYSPPLEVPQRYVIVSKEYLKMLERKTPEKAALNRLIFKTREQLEKQKNSRQKNTAAVDSDEEKEESMEDDS